MRTPQPAPRGPQGRCVLGTCEVPLPLRDTCRKHRSPRQWCSSSCPPATSHRVGEQLRGRSGLSCTAPGPREGVHLMRHLRSP